MLSFSFLKNDRFLVKKRRRKNEKRNDRFKKSCVFLTVGQHFVKDHLHIY